MFAKIMKRGALALAPITITLAVLIWLFSFLEETFRPPVEYFLGSHYIPGMGIVLAIVILFIIGALINTWIMEKLVNYWEKLLKRIPLIKTIYFKIQDVFHFLTLSSGKESDKVVKVEFFGTELIGLVTQDQLDEKKLNTKDHIAVFFPMSYQMGGYMALVPKEKVIPIPMSITEAMEFVIIAGAKVDKGSSAK